jgi:hypothetical protein
MKAANWHVFTVEYTQWTQFESLMKNRRREVRKAIEIKELKNENLALRGQLSMSQQQQANS